MRGKGNSTKERICLKLKFTHKNVSNSILCCTFHQDACAKLLWLCTKTPTILANPCVHFICFHHMHQLNLEFEHMHKMFPFFISNPTHHKHNILIHKWFLTWVSSTFFSSNWFYAKLFWFVSKEIGLSRFAQLSRIWVPSISSGSNLAALFLDPIILLWFTVFIF